MPDYKVRSIPSKEPDLILDLDEEGFVYTVGISFPPYPRLLEKCWRTDIRGGMMFFWDGTYWLSEQQFTVDFTAEGMSVTAEDRKVMPADLAVYCLRSEARCYLNAPNDGSNYLTMELYTTIEANIPYTVRKTGNTSAVAISGFRLIWTGTLNFLTTLGTDVIFGGRFTRVGNPGQAWPKILMVYRLRAT